MPQPVPTPTPQSGLRALRAMIVQRSPLAALEVFRAEMGDVYRANLPGFTPIILAGAEAGRFVLVEQREAFRWRAEHDPVTNLLREGVLVVDGAKHDDLRRRMQPALHKKMIAIYTAAMLRATDQVLDSWESGAALDMLVEMRKIALLIIMQTLYREDFTPELVRLWDAVLKTIQYISPGLWMFWRGAPRPGLTDGLRRMDAYLHRVIDHRRSNLGVPDDLLGLLIEAGMDSELIRDQLLTMFIAGHDTSTALLAWSLVLLGKHPSVLAQVKAEVDAVLQGAAPTPEHRLPLLDAVIDEALRLYPPIHLSSRTAAVDLEFQGYHIPQGARVLFSIYLTQRHPDYWSDAAAFKPERFLNSPAPEPYTYLPFGGGKRNCIGALFAQIETRLVLARIFQRFDLSLIHDHIHAHMGATLEPRPGVLMRVQQR